jgi:restriction endonuclease S subunit
LDGLEVVEVKLNNLLVNNEEFRIDSEFLKKKFTKLDNLLIDSSKLNDLVYMSDLSTNGSFKTVSNIVNDDNPKVVPFIRSGNTGNIFIQKNELIFISKEAHEQLPKSTTKLHDIIMARKGKIGGATIIMSDEVGFNCNENVIKLDIYDKKELNPFYFATFFNSKFGLEQIERLSTGNVQPWVSIYQIRKLIIPILLNNFQLEIEKLVKLAHKELQDSKNLYKKAENLLLEELDLLDFKSTKESISIKSFSESFGSSGRLDSEYYLPKYDEVIKRVKLKKFDRLKNIVDIKKSIETGSEAYSDNGVEYIRVSNLTKFGLSQSSIYIPYDFFNKEQLKELKPKKDTILLSKDGTVGIAYSIKNETNIITSGAILHLNIKDNIVLPEYLTLILNSRIVQMQSQRDAGGSIIKHWKPSEIKEVLIPIIDYTLQTQIESKIKESFRLKEESKRLLELAKRSVEVAIEEGEEIALKFIEKEKI